MKFNTQNFDLNLLAIFDALMVERNVSKAAETEVPEAELSSGEIDFILGVESGGGISKRLHC